MAVFDYTRAWRDEVSATFPPLRRAINSISAATSVLPGAGTATTAADAADQRDQLLLKAAADLAAAQRNCRQLWETIAQTESSLAALSAWLRGPGCELLCEDREGAGSIRGAEWRGRRPLRRQEREPPRVPLASLQAALEANAAAVTATARLAVQAAQDACDAVAACLPAPLLLALGMRPPRPLPLAMSSRPDAAPTGPAASATGRDRAPVTSIGARDAGWRPSPRPMKATSPAPHGPESSRGDDCRGARRVVEADLAAAATATAMVVAAASTPGAAELLEAVPSEEALLCMLDAVRILPLFAAAAAGAGRPDAGRAAPWAGGGGAAFDQACGAISGVRETAVRQVAARAGRDGQAALVPPLHGLLALRPGEDALVTRA